MGITIRGLDVYSKTCLDVVQHSASGGIVTLIAVVAAALLGLTEVGRLLEHDLLHELTVDTHSMRNSSMEQNRLFIHVDIWFEHLPCAVLAIDGRDVVGEYELLPESRIYKRRYDPNGTFIAEEEQTKTDRDREPFEISIFSLDGSATFGTFSFGLFQEDSDPAELASLRQRMQEKCNVVADLVVNKVAGNFHVTMNGQNFRIMHQLFPGMRANMSHTVSELFFGPSFPTLVSPLRGERKVMRNHSMEHGMYEYFLKVVPTEYTHLNRTIIRSHQYSVTDHFKRARFGCALTPAPIGPS
jgi:hypothetical protein